MPLAAAAIALGFVAAGGAGHHHATAGLGLLVLGLDDERSMRALVAAIAIGAAVVGAIAWIGIGFVDVPIEPDVAVGLGIAAGGGLGAMIWLLAIGEEQAPEDETMTVDMAEEADAIPGPEPADLFESHPDPILYVDATDDTPIVLGANPAFAAAFGGDVAEGVPLADAIPADDEAVVEAAAAGREFGATIDCETATGAEAFHVRLVPIEIGDRLTVYVLFGPVAGGD